MESKLIGQKSHTGSDNLSIKGISMISKVRRKAEISCVPGHPSAFIGTELAKWVQIYLLYKKSDIKTFVITENKKLNELL